MTYETAKQQIDEIQKKGSILGLGPVKELLNRLGNPQDSLEIIHVAGTNGKGSICTFLEQLYRADGKRVGRYISPTLHCYLERFQIDGSYMEEAAFGDLFEKVNSILQAMKQEQMDLPTAFEIETAIAFLYFLKQKVDLVILEVGMGGREDATNVVKQPLCTVFASIGMDHMQFLGDTLEKIAYEKAGIMKKNSPAVCYPNEESVKDVLRQCFCEVQEECLEAIGEPAFIQKSDITIVEEGLTGSTFVYKDETYEISLAGRYQIYNAVTAIETKLMLDGQLKKEALKNAKWEGRFELICENPFFVKDGAHNIDGVNALKESIEKHFTNYHLIFIIGVLRDKEYEKMMATLCPLAEHIYTITPGVERGLSNAVLAKTIEPYCQNVELVDSVDLAVNQALELAKQKEKTGEKWAVIAWGSLSYIGEISIR